MPLLPLKSARIRWTKAFARRRAQFIILAILLSIFVVGVFTGRLFSHLALKSPALAFSSLYSPPSSQLTSENYDLPALLDVPSFFNRTTSRQKLLLPIIDRFSGRHPDSLLALYRTIPSVCARLPYVPHLREALRKFAPSVPSDQQLQLLESPDALVVEIDTSRPTDPSFVEAISTRAPDFKTLILLPSAIGSHTDQVISHLREQVEKPTLQVLVRNSQGWDSDLYFMSRAKTLLVHHGPRAALAALASEGKVYYTSAFDPFISNQDFRWLLHDASPALQKKPPIMNRVLGAMGPVIPSCCRFVVYGVGDSEKLVCENSGRIATSIEGATGGSPKSNADGAAAACWVVSIGCGNMWSFEESVIAKTPCSVHVFDCTSNFKVPVKLRDRVRFHKVCISNKGHPRADYETLDNILSIGAKAAGLEGQMPVLAKIDAEGFELPALYEMVSDTPTDRLPEQILLEFHAASRFDVGLPYVKGKYSQSTYGMTAADVGAFFGNLSTRGYQLVYRTDNAECSHCTEVTLLLKDAMPRIV